MNFADRRPYDLTALAPNGLRRGRTTGACATAAVKAALLLLERGEIHKEVAIRLHDPEYFLVVPILQVQPLADGAVRADVIKDGGDDPDNTHGATIFSIVRQNHTGEIRYLAGAGVGTVTEPGIRVSIGEPAINPTPRQMMRWAVEDVLNGEINNGYDLEIGCENGAQIAKKTFNPRLGIVGGISILGTSGIVEPMSLAAYMASIEVYIRVALGGVAQAVVYTPGKLGGVYAKQSLHLPAKRIVQISNFVGFALDFTERVLLEDNRRLTKLWLLGHPGKIAKILDGIWDTHSSRSAMAMSSVARIAADCGFDAPTVSQIEGANTVEAVIELLRGQPLAQTLWREIERRVAILMHARVSRIDKIEVRLFSLQGVALGEAT